MFLAPWATHLAPQPIVPDKRTTARVDIPSCNGWRRLRLEPWGVDENRRVSVSCEAGRGAWTRIGVCQCPAKRARSQTAYRSKASESKRPSRSVRVEASESKRPSREEPNSIPAAACLHSKASESTSSCRRADYGDRRQLEAATAETAREGQRRTARTQRHGHTPWDAPRARREARSHCIGTPANRSWTRTCTLVLSCVCPCLCVTAAEFRPGAGIASHYLFLSSLCGGTCHIKWIPPPPPLFLSAAVGVAEPEPRLEGDPPGPDRALQRRPGPARGDRVLGL